MKVDEWTSEDVHTSGGGEFPPCAGLTSNAFPEAQSNVSAESSQTGGSTRSVHILRKSKVQKEEEIPHWYALRITYGRVLKAHDVLSTQEGIEVYMPVRYTIRNINGHNRRVTTPMLHSLLFVYSKLETIDHIVKSISSKTNTKTSYRFISTISEPKTTAKTYL